MKQNRIVYVWAGMAVAVMCASMLAVVRAQAPSASIWVHIELYTEGRSEYQKKHYVKALEHLVDFREANADLLNSATLSKSQIEFRDKLNATISDCESKKAEQSSPSRPRAAPSAQVHSRDGSKA
jgi:outer membrane protein assembly factor BamD (BamD/ComL family)